MACIFAGLILYSAVAKSVAPPPWMILSTRRRSNTARIALIIAELAISAGLLARGWVMAATAALFAAAASWWQARSPRSGRSQGCGCFGARQPRPAAPSWRNRAQTVVLLTGPLGSAMSALIPAANPDQVLMRTGLVVLGAIVGQVLWPVKDLWFSTHWLRQNADPALEAVIVWAAPLSVRFGLRGVTVRMMAITDPPFADIVIGWFPALLPPSWVHRSSSPRNTPRAVG